MVLHVWWIVQESAHRALPNVVLNVQLRVDLVAVRQRMDRVLAEGIRAVRPALQAVHHVPIHVMVVVEKVVEETVAVRALITDLPQLQLIFNKYQNGV